MALTPRGEAIEEIKSLIRKGQKTSAIIALGKWPVDLIKDVKSQELENDKALDRQRVKDEQAKHVAAKRKLHHDRFLDRMGIKPVKAEELEGVKKQEEVKKEEVVPEESNETNTTVVAPAPAVAILPNDEATAKA